MNAKCIKCRDQLNIKVGTLGDKVIYFCKKCFYSLSPEETSFYFSKDSFVQLVD